MRTMLFVSSLFAASLVTGAALADNHPIEFGRAHGDTFEKTYKASKTESSRAGASVDRTAASGRSVVQQKQNERVNCSSEGADCAASHGHAAHGSAASGSTDKRPAIHSREPASVAERSGKNDRTQCDEAGEGCQMSSKATKAGNKGHGASPTESTPMAQAAMAAVDRKLNQAYAARMSCNEGDECSMSSKDAKKIWRTESFKGGVAGDKGLDFSNAHADLKASMEKARYHSEKDTAKHSKLGSAQ